MPRPRASSASATTIATTMPAVRAFFEPDELDGASVAIGLAKTVGALHVSTAASSLTHSVGAIGGSEELVAVDSAIAVEPTVELGVAAVDVPSELVVTIALSSSAHCHDMPADSVALAARAVVGTSSTSHESPTAAGAIVRADWTRQPSEPH